MIKQIQNEEKHFLVWVIPAPRKSPHPCTCLTRWQWPDRRVEALAPSTQLQEHRLRPAFACGFPFPQKSAADVSPLLVKGWGRTSVKPQVPFEDTECLWCLGKHRGAAQCFATLCQSSGVSVPSAELLAFHTRPPSLSLLPNTEIAA